MTDEEFEPGEGWIAADQLRARLVELDEFGHFRRGWVRPIYNATEQKVIDELTQYFTGTYVSDHGVDEPALMARDILKVLQDECGL